MTSAATLTAPLTLAAELGLTTDRGRATAARLAGFPPGIRRDKAADEAAARAAELAHYADLVRERFGTELDLEALLRRDEVLAELRLLAVA